MDDLPPLTAPGGAHSAYCGVCWEPVYRLWVDSESPDYTSCPFGAYTAQTCPEATGAASRAAFSAELRKRGMTLAEWMQSLRRPEVASAEGAAASGQTPGAHNPPPGPDQ